MARTAYEPYMNITKATEGGLGTTVVVDVLKRNGIRATSGHSIYMGHSLLLIEKGKLTAAKKVIRRSFGKDYA